MDKTPTTPRPNASLVIRMLGPLDVRVQGEPLPPLRSRKGYWLLALLALRAGREVRREWLAETLWPDSFGEEAFASLRQSLRDLRLKLGPAASRIQSPTSRTLRFEPDGAEIDSLTFDQALRRGDPVDLQTAVCLYAGPLLEGCSELWVLPEREAREQGYLNAVEQLAQQALASGDPAAAARTLEPAVWIAPLRQTHHRTLMQALAALGEFQAAVEVYQELRRRLHHDYNTQPDPDTVRVYHEVRAAGQARARQPAEPTAPPALTTAGAPRHTTSGWAGPPLDPLPQPLTPLLGREAELHRLHTLLAPAEGEPGGPETASTSRPRLITLTGPGGVGKTRLVLELAHLLQGRFADGAIFVDLGGARDEAALVQTAALTLGVRQEEAVPLTHTVVQALHHRQLLLVLDNCEQIVEACARFANQLLRRCPGLSILATSRERLGITGETVHVVSPLATAPGNSTAVTPHTDGPLSIGELDTRSPVAERGGPDHLNARTPERLNAPTPEHPIVSPAAALFLQRVVAVVPGFSPGEAELIAAEEICRRLDGLPLALELAAPLAELSPLPELARHLDQRFELLSRGDPTAPERHRSLRAVVDWSYDLLSPDEQRLFRRLSVFSGSWAQAAAERVAMGETPVAPLLQRLVAKSLVTPQPGGDPSAGRRFRLLETLREYAAGRLRESGEEPAIRQRLVAYAVAHAEAAAAELTGPDQLPWLTHLDADYNNMQAALTWCVRRGPRETPPALRLSALRLSAALGRYWQIRGLFGEGYRLLTAALALAGDDGDRDPDETPTSGSEQADPESSRDLPRSTFDTHRAEAHGWAGFLATYLGDYAAAQQHGEASLTLWREQENRAGLAAALGTLGIAAKDRGDRDRARALFAESLELYQAEGDRSGAASMLGYLGIIAAGQQELETARNHYEESLRIRQELQDGWGIAASLNNLGLLARQSGDLIAARRLLEQSLEQRRALGDRRCMAITLNQLGLIRLDAGEPGAARKCFRESLEISRDTGDRRSIAYSLETIARLPATEGGADRETSLQAVRLYAAAGKLRRLLPAPLPPSEAAQQETRLASLRAGLGEAAYDRAWQEGEEWTGKLLTLEEAIRQALFV